MNRFKLIMLLLILILGALLRLLWLDKIPPSLYSDEIDQGYNAYSILLTGRDEHGEFFPLSLRSFGDWKPPVQTYLMVPFIFLFGLNEWSVRLPTVILSILMLYLTYRLSMHITRSNKISALVIFFLAISPWHILQSRASMLVMVALFFLELSIYCYLKGLTTKKLRYFIVSSVSFVLSIYSYYGMRLVAPLVLIGLFLLNLKYVPKLYLKLIVSFLLIGALLTSLLFSFIKEPDVILGRARTISIFYDQGVKLRQWELITQDGSNYPSILARFYHNNFYLFGTRIVQNFLVHFDFRYLFTEGDKSQPFQVPGMGIFYWLDGLFIFIGVYLIYKEKFRYRNMLIYWVIISIIPAALTFMVPASNRTFNLVIPAVIILAWGARAVQRRFKGNKLLISIIVIFYVVGFGNFLHQYFIDLPVNHAQWWNYGWKEVAQYVYSLNKKYDKVVVLDQNGMPYVYFLFYGKVLPQSFQDHAVRPYAADQFGFEHVEEFDNLYFPLHPDFRSIKENIQKNTIYIASGSQTELGNDYAKAIYFPDGRIAYKIYIYD